MWAEGHPSATRREFCDEVEQGSASRGLSLSHLSRQAGPYIMLLKMV